MTDEKELVSTTTNVGFGVTANANSLAFDPISSSDLSDLLQRCRFDLEMMESILGNLESPLPKNMGRPSDQLISADGSNHLNNVSLLERETKRLEADSVRRLAQDIENLCRSSHSNDVQEMLGELQAKMVRCLRLIPAGVARAKAS